MDFWKSLGGMVEVTLTSADPAGAMRAVNDAGIPVFDVIWVDALSVQFRLRRRDHKQLRGLTEKRGDRLSYSGRIGIYWLIRSLLSRPVLVIGIMAMFVLSLWLPSRVFFVQVEGNASVPTRKILEQAQNCGIAFGASRREVRSEKMKNALLAAIPELQWAGINTSGCTAVISVRERTTPEEQKESAGVSSIIASADGVISEMTVLKGSALCKVGQAVKAGQVLVSGYTDCGIRIRAERAQAEIFADTSRALTAVLPAEYVQKGEITGTEKKFSLIIGKKRINFYKGSGISDTTCDKMYSETYLLLPGGFQLPVALVTECWTWREEETVYLDETPAREVLSDFAGGYLNGLMVAGQIRQRYETLALADGIYCQYGKYACTEMICKTRIEENLADYAETD